MHTSPSMNGRLLPHVPDTLTRTSLLIRMTNRFQFLIFLFDFVFRAPFETMSAHGHLRIAPYGLVIFAHVPRRNAPVVMGRQ